MKKSQLLAYDEEIQNWYKSGSVLTLFHNSRINDFYKEFKLRLETLWKEVRTLQEEYFVFENDKVKVEGEGNDRKPICKEGKTIEDFNQAWADLMNQQVSEKRIHLLKP